MSTNQKKRQKIPVKLIVSVVLIVLIIIFATINAEPISVNFLFTSIEFPLVLIILGSTLIGAFIMFGFSYFRKK